MFGVYRNPDLSNNILTLLTAMAKMQSVDRKASFLFVGDESAHHEEWLVYSTTNGHGMVELRMSWPHHRVASRWLRSLHTSMRGA